MTAISIQAPIFQFNDEPMGPFSELHFSLTGTTTTHSVYSNAALSVSLGSTVVSDDNGLFPAIFLDPAIQYRVRGIPEGGDLAHPVIDHDPVNSPASALSAADVETALGYTPVDPAAAVFTAEARLNYASNLTTLHVDSVGFRANPPHTVDTVYTLTLDDAQKLIIHDDTSAPAITIPNHSDVAFPVGTRIYFVNVNTGVPVFTRAGSVQLRIAGAATNQDVNVAEWGTGSLFQYDTDKWMIEGNGLT